MPSRIHLYPPQDNEREVRSCFITADRDFPESAAYYLVRLGIAESGRVDYIGTFDGSRQSLEKGVPYVLFDGTERVLAGQSIVADVDVYGLPVNFVGTALTLFTAARGSDPGQRVRDRDIRSAVDGVADWVKLIRGDEDVVTVILPEIPWGVKTRMVEQDYDSTTGTVLSSATYTNGVVQVNARGSPDRPTIAFVTAHVTFEAAAGSDTVYVAIGDGTTDSPEMFQSVATAGDFGHVSVARVEEINTTRTYTLRYKKAGVGSPVIQRELITVHAMEA